MRDLKTTFGQQIWLKWNYCLQRINVKQLLCVIDVLKDKKFKTFLNAFIEIVNESNRKPNKLWIAQRKEFYNKLM